MKLYLSCFRHQAVDNFGRALGIPMAPSLGEFALDVTHENNQSPPFPAYTSFIHIKTTADCAIAIGPDPVADSDLCVMEAGDERQYGVSEGHKLAVIHAVLL